MLSRISSSDAVHNLLRKLIGQLGCWRARAVHADGFPAGEGYFECGRLGDHGVQHRVAIQRLQLRVIRLMHEQPRVVARHQMAQTTKVGIELAHVVDRLMDRSQPLCAEVFRRNWNHDVVRCNHRRPTAQVQIGRTVDEHDVVAGDRFEKLPNGELLHAFVFRHWPIVLRQLLIRWHDRDPFEFGWLRQRVQIRKSKLIIKERRKRRRCGKIFRDGGTKEPLAERTLRICIDQQDAVTLLGEGSGQVEACGTLSAAALLVDEANGCRHNVSAIWELPMAIPRKPLKSLSIRWHKLGKVATEIFSSRGFLVDGHPLKTSGSVKFS